MDDVLSNPKAIPYTQKTAMLLSPYIDLLKKISQASAARSLTDLDNEIIPSKDFLSTGINKKFGNHVAYWGSITTTERAEINNWIHHNICDDFRVWFGNLTQAHATTLYIRGLLVEEKPQIGMLTEAEQLQKAWDIQYNTPRPFHEGIDVDRECIERLEEEMFEVSERAGIAGNHQWGLDAGDHQYWNPYDGYWHTGEREEDEEETTVSLLYSRL